MAFLTVIHRMTGVTLAWIGPCLDRVEKFKVSFVHSFLNRISSLVTVNTEHLVCMTLLAERVVLLRVDLMFVYPIDLVIRGFWKSVRMAELAVASRGERGFGIIMAEVTS